MNNACKGTEYAESHTDFRYRWPDYAGQSFNTGRRALEYCDEVTS